MVQKIFRVNKILFAETKSKYYFPYQNFYFPLKRHCRELVSFDTRWNYFMYGKEKMNKMFLEFIEKEKPDCIFMWVWSDEFYLDTLLKIREISPQTQTFLFFGDDNTAFESFSRYYILFLDYGLIAQKKYIHKYHRDGIKNVFFVMGLDTNFFKSLNLKKKYDVTFIGFPKEETTGRYEMVKFLKDNGVNIKIFGRGWENHPDLKDIWYGPLESDKMVEVINKSKINLCFSKAADGKPHLKGKVFEGGACKTFVLTEFCEDYLEMFKEGKEIVFFKTREELLEKIKYYLKNEKQREEIANAAYKKIIKNFSLDKDLNKIFTRIYSHKKLLRHKELPKINKKIITITKKDLSEDIEFIKSKLKDYDYIILSDGKSENLKYREYLQAYSLYKTGKPISCCDYYVHSRILGDYLRFSPEYAYNFLSEKDVNFFLNINQLMVTKEYFLNNIELFKKTFDKRVINHIKKEDISFIFYPLIRIRNCKSKNYKIMKKAFEFKFKFKLFSLNQGLKIFLSPYFYFLLLEIFRGKFFILQFIIEVIKNRKINRVKELQAQ